MCLAFGGFILSKRERWKENGGKEGRREETKRKWGKGRLVDNIRHITLIFSKPLAVFSSEVDRPLALLPGKDGKRRSVDR